MKRVEIRCVYAKVKGIVRPASLWTKTCALDLFFGLLINGSITWSTRQCASGWPVGDSRK
jgi:hypothetical protein